MKFKSNNIIDMCVKKKKKKASIFLKQCVATQKWIKFIMRSALYNDWIMLILVILVMENLLHPITMYNLVSVIFRTNVKLFNI